jgi:hypothetical protein
MEGCASGELAGPRRLADFEIHLRVPQRPIGVSGGFEPEFRRVIGESFWVTRHQVLVLCCRFTASLARLLHSTGFPEDTGKRRRVVWIVR